MAYLFNESYQIITDSVPSVTDFSVSLWIKPYTIISPPTVGTQIPIIQTSQTDLYFGIPYPIFYIFIDYEGGVSYINMSCFSSGVPRPLIGCNIQINFDQWNYLFVQYQSVNISLGTMTLYLNNNQSYTANILPMSAFDPAGFGFGNAFPGNNVYFNGELNEIAIWNTILSNQERQTLSALWLRRMPLQINTRPLYYYPCDEAFSSSKLAPSIWRNRSPYYYTPSVQSTTSIITGNPDRFTYP